MYDVNDSSEISNAKQVVTFLVNNDCKIHHIQIDKTITRENFSEANNEHLCCIINFS